MKRYLHFNYWLAAIIIMICGINATHAQTKMTSPEQLKAGSVIKIYPHDHYGESNLALACKDDGQNLTSYEKAGSGDSWTIVDTGEGNYYLKNDLGCYWAYQGRSSEKSLTCTANKSDAVKISLTWDKKYAGVCFWNQEDGTGLNNLFGFNNCYNWFSSKLDYDYDSNSTFDVEIVEEGNGDKIKYGPFKITCIDQLKVGSVINIYPFYSNENNMTLACGGDGEDLTMYKIAGSGNMWTVIDAGGGSYYLKNEEGCYWAYQGKSSDESLTCTTNESDAVKIRLTWDGGVCFWNQEDGTGLNNLNGSNRLYNWRSSRTDYDTNSIFQIVVVKEGDGEPVKEMEKEITVNDINYLLHLDTKTAMVFPSRDYSGDVVIPETVTYEGTDYIVTSLAERCFSYTSNLRSITLPKNITTLSDRCFAYSDPLNFTGLPEGITSLGSECFAYCNNLISIDLPKSITSLGDNCFLFSDLVRITLPEGLISIGNECFQNCTGLKSITLPEKLQKIGHWAFLGNDALETITFKTNETKLTVDEDAFSNCPSLSKVNIEHLDGWAHINFLNESANPISEAHHIYMNNEEIIDVVLPEGTEYIGRNAFNGCSSIKSLTIPSTVEYINDNIIKGCEDLRDVYCYAENVPEFIGTEDPWWMSDICEQATLHVLYGKEDAYKADAWWGNFNKIVGCNSPAGINNISLSNVKVVVNDRHLSVEGLADNDVIQVVNIAGFTVYKGADHEVDLNASGIFIQVSQVC